MEPPRLLRAHKPEYFSNTSINSGRQKLDGLLLQYKSKLQLDQITKVIRQQAPGPIRCTLAQATQIQHLSRSLPRKTFCSLIAKVENDPYSDASLASLTTLRQLGKTTSNFVNQTPKERRLLSIHNNISSANSKFTSEHLGSQFGKNNNNLRETDFLLATDDRHIRGSMPQLHRPEKDSPYNQLVQSRNNYQGLVESERMQQFRKGVGYRSNYRTKGHGVKPFDAAALTEYMNFRDQSEQCELEPERVEVEERGKGDRRSREKRTQTAAERSSRPKVRSMWSAKPASAMSTRGVRYTQSKDM